MTRASALDSESRVHLLRKYLPLLLIWQNVPITFEKKLWFTFYPRAARNGERKGKEKLRSHKHYRRYE